MTYFSVDIETSSTVVNPRGLLTVGVQVVNEDLSEGAEFYTRIAYADGVIWDMGTFEWWAGQDPKVRRELSLEGVNPEKAAFDLEWFVLNNTARSTKAIFVANPVAFDKPWIDQLFYHNNVPNPFDYRSLCLRSMHFGLRKVEWGGDRETWGEFNVPSELLHHALYDAKAQAQELILMLKARNAEISD